MLYLLDANTLINAKNFYYPIDRVPEFWKWLIHQGKLSNIKIPIETYEEFKDPTGKDKLALWAEKPEVKEALLFGEEAEPDLVSRVTTEGYVLNPTDIDLSTMGADPFLISYALKDNKNRCIVTTEVSKPKKSGRNRRIPDVCKDLHIQCIDNFELIQKLDFSTSWQPLNTD